MKITLTSLHLRVHHGDTVTVHPTAEAAAAALATYVEQSWAEVAECGGPPGCGVRDCPGLPETPEELDRERMIALYFAHATDEHCNTASHTVDVDVPAEVADLGDAVRGAVARWTTAPDPRAAHRATDDLVRGSQALLAALETRPAGP